MLAFDKVLNTSHLPYIIRAPSCWKGMFFPSLLIRMTLKPRSTAIFAGGVSPPSSEKNLYPAHIFVPEGREGMREGGREGGREGWGERGGGGGMIGRGGGG